MVYTIIDRFKKIFTHKNNNKLSKKTTKNKQKPTDALNKQIPILFGVEKTIKGQTGGIYNKKIFSFSTPDGAEYAMFASKKIPFSKELSAGILDGLEDGYSNIMIEIGKQQFALIKYVGKEDNENIYEILITHMDEDEIDIQAFAENYFSGYGFKYIDNIKDIIAIYLKNNTVKYRILALIMMMIIGIIMYSNYQKKEIIHIKPPKPQLPSVTKIEEYDAKRILSLKIFNEIFASIKKISEGNTPRENINTTRIVEIIFNPYQKTKPEEPFFDEDDNAWYYNNEDQKRGKMDISYSFTLEKSYPENEYKYNGLVTNKHIYKKTTRNSKEKKFNPEKSEDRYIDVSVACLNKAIKLGQIKYRSSNHIEVILNKKNHTNYEIVRNIRDLMENCPVYAKNLSISGNGRVDGNIYFYYNFKGNKK